MIAREKCPLRSTILLLLVTPPHLHHPCPCSLAGPESAKLDENSSNHRHISIPFLLLPAFIAVQPHWLSRKLLRETDRHVSPGRGMVHRVDHRRAGRIQQLEPEFVHGLHAGLSMTFCLPSACQVLGPCIPVLMIFTISNSKQFCYKILMFLVPTELVQQYVFKAICMCQIMGGARTPGNAPSWWRELCVLTCQLTKRCPPASLCRHPGDFCVRH